MRVLYLTNLPAPYRMLFFQELGKLCDLTAIIESETAADRNKEWFFKSNEWSFRYIPMPGVHWGNDSVFNPSVIRWLNDKHYDIIVVGGYSTPTEILAILYMKLKKIPFVLSSDGGFIAWSESKLKRSFKRMLVSSAHDWMSPGSGAQEYLEFYGADPKKTYFYPFTSLENENILPEPLESSEKKCCKEALGVDGLLVLSVGQFILRKGFDLLLRAWNRVRNENAKLVIIGGGPEHDEYLRMIQDLKLENVKIMDFMKKDQLLLWYRAADIFVLPTRYDIWGLVINEAMAHGLPVISTNGSLAGRELVHDGESGFIIPVENIDELTQRIEMLLINEELRQDMAVHSIDTIRPYTIVNMACTYIKAFEAILDNKKLQT